MKLRVLAPPSRVLRLSPLLSALLLLGGSLTFGCTVTVKNRTDPDNMQRDPEPRPTATQKPTAKPTATTPPTTDPPPKMCTKMGCRSSLKVDVDGGKVGFGKGTYLFEIEANGKKAKCELSLPWTGCNAVKCSGDVQVEIGENGCNEKPGPNQSFGPINFPDAPTNVDVVIKRGGKKISEGHFSPTYKTLQPNGPDCEPTCKQGEEKIVLK